MMDAPVRAALITILKAKRRKLNPAIRKRRGKPSRWLYPATTERHYFKAIKAWFRPMKEYVSKYLKEHSEAILHGDSDSAVLRNDATTGRSFNVMVQSLDAWVGQYFSDDPQRRRESPVYTGLTDIAKTVFNFNDAQYKKSAKEGLGIEFPVNEDWWPDARDQWAYNNYWYMQKYARDYVRQIDTLTERAVTSGWSLSTLTKEIMASDPKMLENKARFLARDQIGKLNGQITQHRMEAAGLSMYVWSTSGDERVRGDPAGFFPDADPSHYIMDNKLCRWDDPTVYSEDGGKTWIDRPHGAVKLHPGEDYNCRCTAMAYWSEIVDEVDEQIDLLSENEDNIPNSIYLQGMNVMKPPSARSSNETVQQRAEAREAKRVAANQAANAKLAKDMFPNETWVDADSLKLDHVVIPENATGIKLAKGKLPINKQEELDLLKEIKSAIVLKGTGASVTLIPRIRRPDGKGFIPGPDAIVNGTLFEFKTVTGSLDKIGKRFKYSRKQGENVYIRVENEKHTKAGIVKYLVKLVNNSKYQGGYKGKIILTVGTGRDEKTYFYRIKDFKK